MKKVSVPTIFALMLCAGLSACAMPQERIATHEVWPDGKPVPRNSADIVADHDARNNPPPPEPYRGGGEIIDVGGYNSGWLPGDNVDIFYQDHNRFNMHFDL
ncbi:MAG: hypothetical protein PHW63_04680 [Alphaproteobacteria bacterium]|nr:hypothetical protein [Alphaproteobacteria bacterium]